MDLSRLRCQSLDDEECYGFRNCCNLSLNSDSEYSGSMSVRDMIRHYDSQTNATNSIPSKGWPKRPHSHHTLCDRKSSAHRDPHFLGTHNAANQLVYHSNAFDVKSGGNCCKNCTTCRCCQNRSRKSSVAFKSVSNNESLANLNAKDVVAQNQMKSQNAAAAAAGVSCGCGCLEFKDDSANIRSSSTQLNPPNTGEKNRLQTTDSTEEATCHPIETSYQSKTTIAKTASGVRIIIDIFFDQELQCVNASNALGSRVETNIPQSRILSEFQQQARAASVTSLK